MSSDEARFTPTERLQKFLARAGVASRRKAEALITAGVVSVNGETAQLGTKVAPGDEVRVNGTRIETRAKTVAYAFYKPAGVLSSVSDDRGRKTVMAYFPAVPGLHPAGRLDIDSEGLLIVTNDGDLTLHLTHPRYGHHKEYRVWCEEGALREADVRQLVAGVTLEDGPAHALYAKSAAGGGVITLGEGRNRQLRRMLAQLGYTVTRLIRTRIDRLGLAGLEPGHYRPLTETDYAALGYTREHEPPQE